MSVSRSAVMSAVLALTAAAALCAVNFIVPPCSGRLALMSGGAVNMKCAYLAPVGSCIAVIWLALAADRFFSGARASAAAFVSGLAAVSITFAWPLGIGTCAAPDMPCAMTAAALRVCGACAALTAAAGHRR